ncbi:MAG TPA: hypothetical protein VG711_10100 [Phycisphaerales bacterium]|nr:hypothetical protein [Phycisphaerales bacterium]
MRPTQIPRPLCLRALALIIVAIAMIDHSAFAEDCSRIGWSALGQGVYQSNPHSPIQSQVTCMSIFDDGTGSALYVGGEFDRAGTVSVKDIAKWNGKSWLPVFNSGEGFTGNLHAMIVFDDGTGPALYVGGDFTYTGQFVRTLIAKFNGKTWTPLLTGASPSSVSCFAIHDDGSGSTLYAGGIKLPVGVSTSYEGVAKLNPKTLQWESFGAAITGPNILQVSSLASDNGVFGSPATLFVGGTFNTIGGESIYYLAQWKNGAWSAFADSSGIPEVMTMFDVTKNPRLIVGGQSIFAAWNGSSWSTFPSDNEAGAPMAFAIQPVIVNGASHLFAGGYFGGAWSTGVTHWDGTHWNLMTSGVEGYPLSMQIFDDGSGPALIVAGAFNLAGGNPASNIAKWSSLDIPQDANRNQFADECDIADGTSADCDANVVPDEAQLPIAYQLDDDEPYVAVHTGGNSDFLCGNQFRVQPGEEVINAISTPASMWARDRLPIRVFLYSDPNNDGDPSDAQVLAEGFIEEFFNQSDWLPLPNLVAKIRPTRVGSAGQSFFIGAFVSSASKQAWIWSGMPHIPFGRCWYKYGLVGEVNPHDLSQGTVALSDQEPFEWFIRAISSDCNQNGIWDACDISSGTSADANNNGIPDECESPCDADLLPLGGNGVIDIDDLTAIILNWGTCEPGACWTDLDHSGSTDVGDLMAVLQNWGQCKK